jgi:hypothetical protein
MLAVYCMMVSCLAYTSALKTRWYVPLKRRLTLTGLRDVISQKTELFITTAMRTSDSTETLMMIFIDMYAFSVPLRLKREHLFPTVISCLIEQSYHIIEICRSVYCSVLVNLSVGCGWLIRRLCFKNGF